MKMIARLAIALLLVPSLVQAADGVLYMEPARGTYAIGDSFEVEIRAHTDGEAANAAEADVSFNPAALEVVRIETDGSVLSLWPTAPTYSNEKGTIRFSGTASASFHSNEAMLIRVVFRALSNVPGDVHIDSGALLLNDVRATNIITGMRSGLYTVAPTQSAPPPPLDVAPATTTEIQTELVPAVKGATIQVPTISGYDDRVSIGERIVLQGSATPLSKLSIFLQFENDAPRESIVLSTADGSFTYVAPMLAERGIYRAWASVETGSGTLTSEKVVLAAQSRGVAAAAETIVPMLTLALPYLLLLVAAGVSLGYFYNRKMLARSISASE